VVALHGFISNALFCHPVQKEGELNTGKANAPLADFLANSIDEHGSRGLGKSHIN
jgi:hypothetical protein